jgi:ketosteroid isomerase-like protein
MSTPTFVVGTGRCGSTMLSNMQRQHPLNCATTCTGVHLMKRSISLTATSLVLLGACTQKLEPADRDEAIAAITKAEVTQAAALDRKDLDGAVAVFAEDAMLYMQDMPPAMGREAIKAVNERVLNDPALNVVPDEASRKWWISASGDLATTIYTSAWTHSDASSGKPVTERLVSQTTWVRQADGRWKNVSDINAVYPAPAAAR